MAQVQTRAVLRVKMGAVVFIMQRGVVSARVRAVWRHREVVRLRVTATARVRSSMGRASQRIRLRESNRVNAMATVSVMRIRVEHWAVVQATVAAVVQATVAGWE